VLLSRGQAAVEAIAAAPDPTSRRDAEAFQQLQLIRQMVELAGQGQWDKVLQVRRAFAAGLYGIVFAVCFPCRDKVLQMRRGLQCDCSHGELGKPYGYKQ
jgi:hypothetical protein